MNRKILSMFLLMAFVVILLTFYKTFNHPRFVSAPVSESKVLGIPSKEEKTLDLNYSDEKITVSWFEVVDINNIYLYLNSDKLTSREFIEKEKCRFLANGGYYKTDFSPTGLLVSEYKKISPLVSSKTANGIFSINDFATPRITISLPADRLRLAVQAGPVLKENSFKKILSLKTDEKARRIVVGVTGNNKIIFMVFYDSSSVYKGPYLSKLPDLIEEFEKATGIVLADALNLDGGAASSFYSDDINLPEATFTGNFFCIK